MEHSKGKGSYNTAGRAKVISFFSSNPDCQFTTEQVINAIKTEFVDGKVPGNSTVYRIVSKLCEEGILRRFRDENDTNFLYQYIGGDTDCENHFHMKCDKCGKVYHLECLQSEALLLHVLDEHGFNIDSGRSILYGECKKCAAARLKKV